MIGAEIILGSVLVYLLCGVAVGVPFVFLGVDRVDESARQAPLGFRLLILPGVVALWPFSALRWLRSRKAEGHE